MIAERPAVRYIFGSFEVDSATGELRRRGLKVKLNAQPFQVLLMLLGRPGEMLTREEICRELWPEGTFVDYEHGLNSAINRLREALGDKANNPKFIETLARRGYRFVAPVFVAPVERVSPTPGPAAPLNVPPAAVPEAPAAPQEAPIRKRVLAGPEDFPPTPPYVPHALFLLLQVMYLGFYVAALAYLSALREFLSALPRAGWVSDGVVITAALLIPVRTFLLCAVLFRAPGIREKFLKMWPLLLAADGFWSLAPFLLRHLTYGLALACTTLLVYSPFAQRSLVLMGAGRRDRAPSSSLSSQAEQK